jgi:S-ribosylhomocysteine lyase
MAQKFFTDKKLKGIVVAMDSELTPILEMMKPYQKFEHLKKTFFYNDNAIVVKSGIGQLYAADAVSSLISLLDGKQNLELIINIGLCGSLRGENFKIGDVLMVRDVVDYDFDISKIDNIKPAQYPGCKSVFFETDLGYYDSLKAIYGDKIKLVRCASGDKFIADKNSQGNLVKNFDADICDMEAAPIAIIAKKYDIPSVIIKAVSDVVSDDNSHETYQNSTKTVTNNYIDVLKLIIENKLSRRITSFSINHDILTEGFYTSRIDGDIYTYDLRFVKPNKGVYLDIDAMHSVEHLAATFLRNSEYKDKIIYFGPMGCRTGFYLLLKDTPYDQAKIIAEAALESASNAESVPGTENIECGNAKEHNLEKAKKICKEYLEKIKGKKFKYQ